MPFSLFRSGLLRFAAATLVAAAIGANLRLVAVDGQSMEPNYEGGQLLVAHSGSWGITHGSVVVVEMGNDGIRSLKRVIGMPGDRIELRGSGVWINGAAIAQEGVIAADQETPIIVTLSADQYWLMGDNRLRSSDSRRYGAFRQAQITGVVVFGLDPLGAPR
jgi:signal peptidase I